VSNNAGFMEKFYKIVSNNAIVAYHAVRMRQITLGHITHASNNTVSYHAGTEISEGIICQDMEFLRTNMSGYGIFLEEK